MPFSIRLFVCLGATLPWFASQLRAQLDAGEDHYVLSEAVLAVETPGVLENDGTPGAELEAVLVEGPQHGNLVLLSNGAFRYEPEAGFSGQDQFTYRAYTTTPLVNFTIDPSASNGVIAAQVTTAFGSDSDDAQSRLGGSLQARLVQEDGVFTSIQVRELNASLLDPMGMDFCLIELLLTCLASLEVTTQADDLAIAMKDPGPPAAVVDGSFNQTGNDFSVEGDLSIVGTGQAAGLIPADRVSLDGVEVESALEGELTASDDMLTLQFPLTVEGETSIEDQGTATIQVVGQVIATAPASAFMPGDLSAPVVVTIEVGEADSDGDGMRDSWEAEYGLLVGTDDSGLDADGDGQTNLAEFESGTSPIDPTDVFQVIGMEPIGNALLITFRAREGFRYGVQESSDLSTWQILDGVEVAAEGEEAVFAKRFTGEKPPRLFHRLFPLSGE